MVTAKTIGGDGEEQQIQNTININNRNDNKKNTFYSSKYIIFSFLIIHNNITTTYLSNLYCYIWFYIINTCICICF